MIEIEFFPTDGLHGLIYWCLLIFLISFFVGMQWVVVRVLLPLHRLTQATTMIISGDLPAFDIPLGGIREIDQLRTALRHMTAQIRLSQEREAIYRAALTETQEQERKRIAREIHDDTIQALILVSHTVDRAKAATQDSVTAVSRYLDMAREQILGVVNGLRQLITNLRPTVLDELGLVTALEVLCEPYPAISYQVVGEVYSISHSQELVIFRAAQEALRNAQHHAQATHITMTLTYAPTSVNLSVNDDGIGFNIPVHLQEFAMRGHYGLMGISERVHHLGGQLRLMSAAASGTQVMVELPKA